ncbi:MAG: type II toxin-antitoxin system VapC family toxin, partial [Bauldia sp.]
MIVLDASVTLASLFEDERTPAVVAVMDKVGSSGAFVPSLWPLEVANGLRIAIRRNRISPSFRDAGLAQLAKLAVEIDAEKPGTLGFRSDDGIEVWLNGEKIHSKNVLRGINHNW